jgi:hypothetical protein
MICPYFLKSTGKMTVLLSVVVKSDARKTTFVPAVDLIPIKIFRLPAMAGV